MNADFRDALAGFLEQPEDPVEGALVAARIIDPEADATWARQEIASLAQTVAAGDETRPEQMVAALRECGFRGAGERYYEVENSVLDHVLRTRRGIPVSLAVVLMGVARKLGLAATGINFPRHFLVTIGDLLVDPYEVAATTVAACREWLRRNRVAEDGAFNVAAPKDIVLRMLNNVRMTVARQGDHVRALDISDYQLMIVPDAYGLYVERADAWLRLRAPEMAADELDKAAAHAPDEAMRERLRERIAQTRRRKSAVH